MAIEINSSNHGAQALATTVAGNGKGTARNEANSTATESNRSTSSDSVSLTGTAQHLRSLEQSLASQPVVDTQRVAATRQAIENGSYEIDPNRIAGKMISMELALNGVR
jgi:negative regulator of flagellin synthesis FlgM